jgi:hypothetical protein
VQRWIAKSTAEVGWSAVHVVVEFNRKPLHVCRNVVCREESHRRAIKVWGGAARMLTRSSLETWPTKCNHRRGIIIRIIKSETVQ